MVTAPRILRVERVPDPRLIEEAAAIVREGGLVAFPTETVYGLAADASNPAAVARLNQVKGRPPEKPYSWHVHSVEQLEPLVGELPPPAVRLIERFWPGPLTIILPTKTGTTIGFRLPDHPVARAFLAACRVPVVAPSANRSGEPPPRDAQAVLESLDGAFDALLDAGPTPLGKESTVVEVQGNQVDIRRKGAISREEIDSAIR